MPQGADQVSQPADHPTENEDDPASGDVRTARLLVAGQFVLIGILVLLPGRHDRPVVAALKVACSIGTVVGLAVMVIGATGLGRGLTATPFRTPSRNDAPAACTGTRGTPFTAGCSSRWPRSRWPLTGPGSLLICSQRLGHEVTGFLGAVTH